MPSGWRGEADRPTGHPHRGRPGSRRPTSEVTIAWLCYQQLRSAFTTRRLAEGQKIALRVLESFHTCPVPKTLGCTLRAWKDQFLGYFTTNRPATAAPKQSTASSNSTAASPAASAIQPTTERGRFAFCRFQLCPTGLT
jgi:hypothetical protein